MAHFLRVFITIVALLVASAASATDITVSGIFTNKAVVQIDGGSIQTLSVGQTTPGGVKLISVDANAATFDVAGKRLVIGLGEARGTGSASGGGSAILSADTRGHFVADAQVNGVPIRFLVDTGASSIALPRADAQRMGIEYCKGKPAYVSTANGVIQVYVITLDTVKVGDINLHGVEATVADSDGLNQPLLGMSFLNRVELKREGDVMTLKKRY